jgi:uncharacterized protein (TIGR03382 family)
VTTHLAVAFWRKDDTPDGCGSTGTGVVASFASVALGWRFEAAFCETRSDEWYAMVLGRALAAT